MIPLEQAQQQVMQILTINFNSPLVRAEKLLRIIEDTSGADQYRLMILIFKNYKTVQMTSRNNDAPSHPSQAIKKASSGTSDQFQQFVEKAYEDNLPLEQTAVNFWDFLLEFRAGLERAVALGLLMSSFQTLLPYHPKMPL